MVITEKEIREAAQTLQKYKAGKVKLDERIVEDELFWKRMHWEQLRDEKDNENISVSCWLFNTIINKHADAMDNIPEAVFLPREESDEETAKMLSSVMPVILEQNIFEDIYSNAWWYKLKHGCCAYGVFWNGQADEGRGNVEIKVLDLLNMFWQPGITNIQDSRNLFICNLMDVDVLKESYPKIDIKGTGGADIKQYVYDDSIDTSDKALVVDWYYKKNGKLHYCKFCEEKVLFASENEKGYENGWYEDGMYPVVFDTMYPEAGTPVGFGVVSVTKAPQTYIDKLDGNIAEYLDDILNPRFFAKRSAGINKEEFLDKKNRLIEVEGDIDEERLRQVSVPALPGNVMDFRRAKIDELKETSGNNDFSQGNTARGVTSGSAIATLQEAGNKLSRDMINASHRAFAKVAALIVERCRQFFDIERVYRITEPNNKYNYMRFSNKVLKPQGAGNVNGEKLMRKVIFDIRVHAQKKSPFSTISQNETAMNLLNAGVFNPQRAQEALQAVKLMTFEGKDEVLEYIWQGMTLQNQLKQMESQFIQAQQIIAKLKKRTPTDAITGGQRVGVDRNLV